MRCFRLLIASFIVMIHLTGCAGSYINEYMKVTMGLSEEEICSIFGYPQSKLEMGNNLTVYSWNTHFSVNMPKTDQYYTTGTIGSTMYNATTTAYGTAPVDAICRLEIAFKDRRSKSWSFQGNELGCGTYATALRNYVDSLDKETLQEKLHGKPTTDAVVGASRFVGKQAYPECVQHFASELAKKYTNLDELTGQLEQFCYQRVGYMTKNLARFYAREALNK